MAMRRTGTAQGADTPPPPRSSIGDTLLVGGVLLVVSVLAALTCYSAFSSWLPDSRGRLHAYRSAETCPARAVTPRTEDCLREVAFTVESTRNASRRIDATLLGPEPFPRTRVSFGHSGPVLSGLEPKDRITGTVWRGLVVEIAQGDIRQESTDAPRDEPQMIVAAGTFAGLVAALALVFGGVRLVRPRHLGFLTWRPYGKWLFVVTGVSCAVVGLTTVWTGLPWLIVPTVCGTAVALTAWFLHRDLRRGRVGQARAE
ncbi:hypothetical protein AB0C61_31415 [Streptomyces sp. NPDC048680]|uniref:hypothetical protein n=1 Tax=Streptomyces sp. NPDC048680 TaxID=3155492 RepID=UPI00342D1DBE